MTQPERYRITSDHDTMVVTFLEANMAHEGELQETFDALRESLDELDLVQVVLDFRVVRFVPSSVLGQLVALKRFLDERGGAFHIAQVNEDIKDTLRVTRLDEWIEVHDTIDEAITALRAERKKESARASKRGRM